MTADNSIAISPSRKPRRRKPKKPYPEFPLFAHNTRRWAKKILGKTHYFGPWDDPQAALNKYLDQRDDLHAGRTPRQQGGFTVADLCNRFMTSKKNKLDKGELNPRTFLECYRACEHIVKTFGRDQLVESLRPDDFE